MTFVSTKWIADQFIGFREVMEDVDDDLRSKCIMGVWEGSRPWATMGSHTLYKYIVYYTSTTSLRLDLRFTQAHMPHLRN